MMKKLRRESINLVKSRKKQEVTFDDLRLTSNVMPMNKRKPLKAVLPLQR